MSKGTYSNSARHRMHETSFKFKEGDDVLYTSGEMIGSGTLFKIIKDSDEVIVQTGNGGRGLEYIKKSRILQPQSA